MSIFHGRPVSIPDNPYVVADKSYFYIKDFRQIPTFAERPFVVGHPHMVSYLEIPLFAMSGHILGSYCVVDNKERDFLHPKSLSIMREITSAISSYLDMRRVEASKSRAASMMQGLRRFVASDWRNGCDVVPEPVAPERHEAHTDPFDLDVFSATTQRKIGSIPSDSAATRVAGSDPTQPSLVHEPAAIVSSPQDADSKAHKPDLSTQFENLFVRAAENIGHAMDLDGLVFFDTVSTGKHRGGQSKDTVIDETSLSPNDSAATPLSCYQRDVAVSQQSSLKLSQSLIQRLTARYIRGHVFAVDEQGVIQHGGDGEPGSSPDSLEDNEWTDLFKSLPKTRYAIFLPMWHYQREACYATCLAWVSDTGKTLDTGDINSLTAFGNSLMAEIFRLEASANTLSKSDFVSTISHELRSPLHGILASIELIQENSQGSNMMPEIAMIESCASTLLDTFDHLLEYSKVNSRASVGERDKGRSIRSGTHVQNDAVTVDLASMVEDVVETVSVGHDHSSRLVSGLKKERQDMLAEPRGTALTEPIVLTTHIERDRDWNVVIEKGAWKRILLNIVSNALKYTRSGYIHVDLGFVEAADDVQSAKGRQAHISLSVTDTGVGMSKDFLKYHLFTPFTQENVLSPGTGLGLSLVKSIVESLQGKIIVSSRLEEGTKITVNIPTSQKIQKQNVPSMQESSLRGKTVGLLSLSSHEKPGNQSAPCIVSPPEALERSIRNICEGRFGMSVINISTSALPAIDIVLVDAHALDLMHAYDLKTLLPVYAASICPVVVELGNTNRTPHKVGSWRSMHTMLVTGKSLGSALISALEDANANGMPPAEIELKPEIDSTEQLDQYHTTKKAVPHIETVTLPHRGLPLQSKPPFDAMKSPAPQSQSPVQAAALLKPNSACRFHRLLLVDDNPINLKMLCAFAKRLNVPYSSATDGEEAVRLYQAAAEQEDPQMSYDCIFMDISMPVMDGFQAVSKIRRIEDEFVKKIAQSQSNDASKHNLDGAAGDAGGARAYIFALTGLGSEKARKQARCSGFDEFLLKPVRFKDILPMLAPVPTS
jgi:signal transduction histidine kinase